MELGSRVFCVDPKTKNVYEGTLIGKQISTTGYELCSVLNSKGDKKSIEDAHVHTTKDGAEKHLKRVSPIMVEADKIIDGAKVKVDALRITVIGEAKHEELANKIMGSSQVATALSKKGVK